MAWNWSHTVEGLEGARAKVGRMERTRLVEAWAEWEARGGEDDGGEPGFDLEAYERAKARAEGLPDDVLADAVWSHAEEAATCDNGGSALWVCPWGCHTVPPEPLPRVTLRAHGSGYRLELLDGDGGEPIEARDYGPDQRVEALADAEVWAAEEGARVEVVR